ncbi:hypothetical protein UB31_09705 [Bradyrhizobium sp. LTSP849]|uniref:hypothetical protein n=1 Tax=Bradyrhizobium sp. LTSP849 TaxID=1615890 RepID=UPI0005D24BBC|nr:hypothetical protein [Bradyrhizobium sp. LTSP849]KJC52552.1 hypothetical protein UB31_09705 [Bradyrhizobium sp. LTSP849]
MTTPENDLDALGALDYLNHGTGEVKLVLAKELNRPDLADLSNEAAGPILEQILRSDPRALEIMRVHFSRSSKSQH